MSVDVILKYRGRAVTAADLDLIRALIATHHRASRRELSKRLCEAWSWVQPNGQPRDMVCRGLMLALARQGHIELPPIRQRPCNPLAEHKRPEPLMLDARPVRGELKSLGPLDIVQVRRTREEAVFNGLVEAYHYLGYTQPVGEHLKYLVYAKEAVVAALAWSSAPRHLGPRDRFIGWSQQARRRNIRFLAYNTRFLILPWVEVEHLASHLLGRMAKVLGRDWERVYGHPLYFLETFVEPERFRGTCYRAANWVVLGRTQGLGKDARSKKPNRSKKELLGYPLIPRFREMLGSLA